jgi:hypothetical protein
MHVSACDAGATKSKIDSELTRGVILKEIYMHLRAAIKNTSSSIVFSKYKK